MSSACSTATTVPPFSIPMRTLLHGCLNIQLLVAVPRLRAGRANEVIDAPPALRVTGTARMFRVRQPVRISICG